MTLLFFIYFLMKLICLDVCVASYSKIVIRFYMGLVQPRPRAARAYENLTTDEKLAMFRACHAGGNLSQLQVLLYYLPTYLPDLPLVPALLDHYPCNYLLFCTTPFMYFFYFMCIFCSLSFTTSYLFSALLLLSLLFTSLSHFSNTASNH